MVLKYGMHSKKVNEFKQIIPTCLQGKIVEYSWVTAGKEV